MGESVSRSFAGREPSPWSAHHATACPLSRAIGSAARRPRLPGRAFACRPCAGGPRAGVRPCDVALPAGNQFSWPSPTPSCPSRWVARKGEREIQPSDSETNSTPQPKRAGQGRHVPYGVGRQTCSGAGTPRALASSSKGGPGRERLRVTPHGAVASVRRARRRAGDCERGRGRTAQ